MNQDYPDVMNDILHHKEHILKIMVLISQLEVYQKEGVKKGGTWRTFRVPEHFFHHKKLALVPKEILAWKRHLTKLEI